MKKASDILARKGTGVISISPETTVLKAIGLMAEKNIGSVVVMDGSQFMGIMTERDYCRKVILKGKSSTDTEVAEIMSVDFPPITPSESIEHCMELMTKNNIRYLPVYENGQVCGIISMQDVIKQTVLRQEETISQLKDYLHASM
jgi:CBS domain-containing protein